MKEIPDHLFTGKRRKKIERVCACGCGEKFTTTHPTKRYINNAHRMRAARKKR